MILKIYEPYSVYDVIYAFKKERELSEMEAIIFSVLIFYPKKQDKVIDLICHTLNLDQEKWKDFIIKILEELNDNEIEVSNLDWQNCFLDDIKIHPSIIKNFNQNKFRGLEQENQPKQQRKLCVSLFSNEIKTNISKFELYKNSEELKEFSISKSKTIDDLLNQEGEEIADEKKWIFFKKIINNENECRIGANIIYANSTEIEVKIKDNEIISQKIDFVNLVNFYQQYKIESNLIEQIASQIKNSDIDLIKEFDDEDQNNFEKITTLENYKKIIDEYDKFRNQYWCEDKVFLMEGQFVKLVKKKEILQINDFEIFIEVDFLYKKIFNLNVLNFIENNLDKDLIILWTKLKDEKLKKLFKEIILEEKINFFSDFRYKNWIIKHIKDSKDIDKNWLFSSSVNFDEFKQIFNQKNELLFKTLEEKKTIVKFDTPDNIEKVNYLYNHFDLDFFDLNIDSEQLFWYQEIGDLMKKVDKSNDLIQVEELINKIDKTKISIKSLKNRLPKREILIDKREKIIKENKEYLIKEIKELFVNKIKGKLDNYLKKLVSDEWLKTNLKDGKNQKSMNAKIIQFLEKKKLLSANQIANLWFLNEARNNFAHEDQEKVDNELREKDLTELAKYYEDLKEKSKILNQKGE